MRWWFSAALFCSVVLAGCVTSYDGTGGGLFGTPSAADIRSGRADFDPDKFAAFKVGSTTKPEVIATLGKPAYWQTKTDGTSALMYQYVLPGGMLRQVVYVWFYFDATKVLMRMQVPVSM